MILDNTLGCHFGGYRHSVGSINSRGERHPNAVLRDRVVEFPEQVGDVGISRVPYSGQTAGQHVLNSLVAALLMLAGQLLYADECMADSWQQAVGARISTEYDTNPVMSSEHSDGVWRALFDPSYTLTGRSGENEITTGLAMQIARASDKTLSPDRESPNAYFNWLRPNETGEFGISTRYSKSATRDTVGVDATGRTPAVSTSVFRRLSGNWRNDLSERGTLSMDCAYEGVSYSGSAMTDYSSRFGGGRWGYTLTEQITTFISASINKYVPDGGGTASSRSDTMLGMSWKVENWDWTLQAGKTRGGGNSDTQGSIEALYAGQRSQMSLNAGRMFRASGFGGFVKADQVRGSWNYALSEYSNIGIELERQKILSTTIGTDTSSTVAGARIERELTDSWRIQARLLHRTLQGGGSGGAISNVIGLSVVYHNPNF